MSSDISVAQEYKRRVLGAFDGRVAKLVLYGSRARGDARPDSDWDIAVFMTDDPTADDLDRLSDLGVDLLYETGHAVDAAAGTALRRKQHPAQDNPLRGSTSLKEEVRQHLRWARRLLAMVEARVDIELPEIIAHTAYYAMYHPAVAVFLNKDVPVPKTHNGIVTRFSQLDRDQSLGAKVDIARLSRGFGASVDR